jgi:hypothetical protein
VKDLIDTTIPTLISRAENIISEIEDVVDNSNSGGSSGIEFEYENTAQDIYG